MKFETLGRHILVEYYNCNEEMLANPQLIEEYMNNSALNAKATIVDSVFHHFNPWGVSGAVIIADYFILNKRSYTEFKYAKFKTVNINAIIAWIAGVIGAYTLKGITPLNSVIVAIVTYVVLSKLNTKSKSNDINNRTGKVA